MHYNQARTGPRDDRAFSRWPAPKVACFRPKVACFRLAGLPQRSQPAGQRCLPRLSSMQWKKYSHYNLLVNAYHIIGLGYKFLLTLSVTQVACERTFSTLKYVKNRIRSSMSQDRLEAFLLMSTQKEALMQLDTGVIIDKVAETSNYCDAAQVDVIRQWLKNYGSVTLFLLVTVLYFFSYAGICLFVFKLWAPYVPGAIIYFLYTY